MQRRTEKKMSSVLLSKVPSCIWILKKKLIWLDFFKPCYSSRTKLVFCRGMSLRIESRMKFNYLTCEKPFYLRGSVLSENWRFRPPKWLYLDCVWILMVLIVGSITLCVEVYNGRQGLPKHELWHSRYFSFFITALYV